MKKEFTQSGYFMALLATVVWSGNFIVARGLSEIYTPISIAFFRWLIASVVIFPFALPYLRRDFNLLVAQWRLMLVLSFLGVTLFNTLIYLAAHFTSALNLSLFAITAPLYVVILNRIIFKEQLSARQIFGFVVLIIGLLVLLSKGNPSALFQLKFNTGDLLMAAAASIFGTYSALVKLKSPSMGNLSFVSATFILGVLMLLPIFIGEQILFTPEVSFYPQHAFQLFYIGIGPSILSFYLWNKSIVRIGSTKAASIYNTLPIFSAAFGILILNEPVLFAQVVSAIVIVMGVLLVIHSKAE